MPFTERSAFAKYVGPQKKPVIDTALLGELSQVAVLENQACARKVALAAHMWDSCIHQTIQVGDLITDAGNYAASETAKILGCSKTVADTFAEIGMDLRLRLPAIKKAFDAGELDLARVRAIYRVTSPLSLDAATRIEAEVLQAARRLSPGPLATEIAAIIQRTAPDEVAEVREDLKKLTGVRYRDKDLIATIEATLDAADAAACWQSITEMAATLCPRDPRTRSQRLAAAYTACIRRETHLACTCEVDEDHPCTANRVLPDRRVPLTSITIDLATLAAFNDLPAYLAGHGLIDAAYARELAANSDWQIVITEARNIADELHITLDNNTANDTANDDDAATAEDTDTDTDTKGAEQDANSTNTAADDTGDEDEREEDDSDAAEGGAGHHSETTETAESEIPAAQTDDQVDENHSDAAKGTVGQQSAEPKDDTGDAAAESGNHPAATGGSTPVNHLTFHPLGRGRRRRGLNLPKPAAGATRAQTVPNNPGPYRGSYTLIAALEKAIAANPAVAQALYPDGHGGFIEPPAGALQYKPRTQLADLVRHRDRTCRFPGCDVPAASCELDHIIPYLHHDPARGGWTILTNLHCLCRYHHSLKTMGAWHTTMLAGAIEHWTSNSDSTAVTLPGSSVGATDLTGHTLTPHIPRKRRPTCKEEPAEPESTAPPPVEPDKTNATEKTSEAEKASETTTHDQPTDPWNVDITGKGRVDADDPAPF
ncbi:HNH endonuclease signature motif containing protein [Rhodococcus sp. Eu-32]|uniref:HNH endonuclease signature motif containing protein n=1 Tax=Rhodococcus sp. Eu-32 TaxID=1017319 RepID=UPI001FB2315F|nr:HNH endonuclease signature motif containing protein [Rhodococcus sp. Eu-32]